MYVLYPQPHANAHALRKRARPHHSGSRHGASGDADTFFLGDDGSEKDLIFAMLMSTGDGSG